MAPRLGTGKKRGGAGKGGNGGNGRPLEPTDNLSPEERKKAREEAEAMQLMSVVAQVKAADRAVAAARVPYDAAVASRKEKIHTAIGMGFKKYEIEDLVKDGNAGERAKIAEKEARRYRFRKIMGLPVSESDADQELTARLPEVEANGQHWQAAGYSDGVSGAPHDPPKACIEAGHGNRYDEGYKDGQAIVMSKSKLTAPKAAPAAEPSEFERKRAEKAEEKRVKEALDKAAAEAPAKQDQATCTICGGPEGDGPPDDAAICPGCDAEWLPPETGQAMGAPTEENAAAEPFEASAEELAAQAGRPSTDEPEPSEVV
jgi:hypothetical protein